MSLHVLRSFLLLSLVVLCLPTDALSSSTAGEVRRFALLAGTNDGGAERARLRYAVSDAKNLAAVLQELGGVSGTDVLMIEEADRDALTRGLRALGIRLREARGQGARTEVIVYYSGHSDERGLLLGTEHFTYAELRESLAALPADLRVAILDSCASGSMTRRKGGVRRPAFLLDTSTDIRGQAILTSSSMDEASQESDRLGASFFTHHLVSGLRGAADSSRDGVVTLNEAYEYAFRETLARTEATRAGPQHPVYDVDLVGSGELVLTDLRSRRAGIVFAADVEGQLFVRDAQQRLLVELRKSRGDAMGLSLGAGTYVVSRQTPTRIGRATVTVGEEERRQIAEADFRTVQREATVRRGDAEVTHRFFNLSLVPPLELSTLDPGPVHHRLSFGLLIASSDGIDGFAYGSLAHWTRGDARGVQLSGALNHTAGSGTGIQLAGAVNHTGRSFLGLQLAGALNWTAAASSGSQVAGAMNWSGGPLSGVQLAGGFNHAQGGAGWQLAGGVNHAHRLQGLQLAPINTAGSLGGGVQLGVVNIGGAVEGAQVGVVNIAHSVHGAQIGLLNLAHEVQGESLGLISLARNGRIQVEAYSGDSAVAGLALKLGAGALHSVLTAEWLYAQENRPARWSTGLGFGAFLQSGRWSLSPDLVMRALHQQWLAEDDARFLVQLRVLGGYRLADRLTLIAGPTLNVGFHIGHATPPTPTLLPTWSLGRTSIWPGVQAGLRY